jgi:hypothetical protein
MASKNNTGTMRIDLIQDHKGMVWDLLLYIPTVIALASIAASFWYSDEHNMGYLFFFLTCFFFIAGFNRVFKTRLMLLPSAPISLQIEENSLQLTQRDGTQIYLFKNLRYYADFSGKTFGLAGLDGSGKQLQFVFHKGQFATLVQFDAARDRLKQYQTK